ncbi:hypothetical protein K6Y31_06040 [Motilimonas cestriensis]|uniref:Phage protein n=1 Tax=Motilimonas cestriensis TaxID=2742685 RepID=A0ABS8W7A6_9GAMM|nr:hypothetical protein [Motilimonas cestriensis]MCE2594370.1 hypothetical protein [Motilimonas cestriensis]
MSKPSCEQVLQEVIAKVKAEFPFHAPESSICSDHCEVCTKKLLELVEMEIIGWQTRLYQGDKPNFAELNQFVKLCKNVRRALVRNGLLVK